MARFLLKCAIYIYVQCNFIVWLQVFVQEPTESLLELNVHLQLAFNNDRWEGSLIRDEIQPSEEPQPTQSTLSQQATDSEKPEETLTSPQELHSSESIGVSVILTHIDSPSEFYLQLANETESVAALQNDLQNAAPDLPVLDNPSAGVLCAAPYSVDQQWYRAQVLDADADITTVRFVDYGNTDVLSNSTTSVKLLPPELLALEQHARRCSLSVKPCGEEWAPAATTRFEELTDGVDLIVSTFLYIIIHKNASAGFHENLKL